MTDIVFWVGISAGVGLIFSLLIMGFLVLDWKDDIKILLELIPCKDLKENSIFLDSTFSKDYIKDECF